MSAHWPASLSAWAIAASAGSSGSGSSSPSMGRTLRRDARHDLHAVAARRDHEAPRLTPVLGPRLGLEPGGAQPLHRRVVVLSNHRDMSLRRNLRRLCVKHVDLHMTGSGPLMFEPEGAVAEGRRRLDELEAQE